MVQRRVVTHNILFISKNLAYQVVEKLVGVSRDAASFGNHVSRVVSWEQQQLVQKLTAERRAFSTLGDKLYGLSFHVRNDRSGRILSSSARHIPCTHLQVFTDYGYDRRIQMMVL